MANTNESTWVDCDTTPRDRRNQRRVTTWALAWAGSVLAATAAMTWDWLPAGAGAVVATGVVLLLGLGTARAYWHFLRQADELRRHIEMGALAAGFAVGVLGGMTWWLLAQAGSVPEMDFAWVFAAMLLTQGLGVLVGRRRYA
ncbi:MAG TPA: hypothetical protein VHQ65_07355 [Thermoanaerobaculia bacterium]|nr:hypothetical protein [Thermoanaerobaculia bacterium]